MTIENDITSAGIAATDAVFALETATRRLCALPSPPQGHSLKHRAAAAYVQSCLNAARKLQADLMRISD